MRVEGAHLIPSGRSNMNSPAEETTHRSHRSTVGMESAKTPRPHAGRSFSDVSIQAGRPRKRRDEVCKAKAFAFFGQVSPVVHVTYPQS
jgi:hypothetical protein